MKSILQFLQTIYNKKLGYSAINTAKSAIGNCVVLKTGETIGSNRDIQSYMRGVFNTRTPIQKKTKIWDPELVVKLD